MSEIERLREEIESERQSWPGDRWRCSGALREKIAEVARREMDAGVALSRLAKDLGLAFGTLKRWVEPGDEWQASGFRAVEVIEGRGEGLRVISPRGLRVEGLSLSQVEALLSKLG